ncbi:MAG: hypothetical protein WAO35_04905 [Terriglobia bacterium]
MPNVNIRQLRDTRRLKAWLRAGKTVELREGHPYRPHCSRGDAAKNPHDTRLRRHAP